MGSAAESQVELAELALEEGHPEQTEPLLRTALAEFETEKSDLDAASAYVVLSRDLMVQCKLDEARKAISAGRRTQPHQSRPDIEIAHHDPECEG